MTSKQKSWTSTGIIVFWALVFGVLDGLHVLSSPWAWVGQIVTTIATVIIFYMVIE